MDWEGCSTARVEWGDIGLPHFRMLHGFFLPIFFLFQLKFWILCLFFPSFFLQFIAKCYHRVPRPLGHGPSRQGIDRPPQAPQLKSGHPESANGSAWRRKPGLKIKLPSPTAWSGSRRKPIIRHLVRACLFHRRSSLVFVMRASKDGAGEQKEKKENKRNKKCQQENHAPSQPQGKKQIRGPGVIHMSCPSLARFPSRASTRLVQPNLTLDLENCGIALDWNSRS